MHVWCHLCSFRFIVAHGAEGERGVADRAEVGGFAVEHDGFARIPWRMAFLEERARPSGVTAPVDFAQLARDTTRPAMVIGPRDLALLAREASIRRLELIFV